MVKKKRAEKINVYNKIKLQIIHKGKYSSYRFAIGLTQDDVCKFWSSKKKLFIHFRTTYLFHIISTQN
jgi:hypothetical protein